MVLIPANAQAARITGTKIIIKKDIASLVFNFKSMTCFHTLSAILGSLSLRCCQTGCTKKTVGNPRPYYITLRFFYTRNELFDLLQLHILLKSINLVKCFPRKVKVVSSEMSVSCCLSVNRTSKIQHLDDSCRSKVEVISNDSYKFAV